MKKILILCSLLLTLFTSVCSADPVSEYCKLDKGRWIWIGSTDYQGNFFDRATVESVPGKNEKKVWVCTYTWVDDSMGKGIHYVYVRYGINYDSNTSYMEKCVVQDAKMNVVQSYGKLKYDPQPLRPGTLLGRLAKRIRSYGNGSR